MSATRTGLLRFLRLLLGLGLAALSLASVGIAAVPVAADPPPSSGPKGQPHQVVYLTFDDGPDTYTPLFLNLLAEYDIKATFFVVGRNVLNFPDTALRISAEGHVLANHTYDHSWLTRSDPNLQFTKAQSAIASVTGITPACYRPPYAGTNDQVRAAGAELGLTEWLWDIDTHDWRRSVSADQIVETLDGADYFPLIFGRHGPVVLLHDGGPDAERSHEALADWLAKNHDRYEFRVLEGCENRLTDPPPTDALIAPEQTIEVRGISLDASQEADPSNGSNGSNGQTGPEPFSRSAALFAGLLAQVDDPVAWAAWNVSFAPTTGQGIIDDVADHAERLS